LTKVNKEDEAGLRNLKDLFTDQFTNNKIKWSREIKPVMGLKTGSILCCTWFCF
jgi:hypothetical protein